MDLGLRGKRALITGESKGIGRAVAEVLAEEGCGVMLASRTGDTLQQAADAIRAAHNGPVEVVVSDLSRTADQDALAAACGDVDILVNNAGANPPGTLDDVDDATWRGAWDLKVFGFINVTRGVYRHMAARGRGVIVNIIGSAAAVLNAIESRLRGYGLPSRWGRCRPHPSQTRTCGFPASGSSRERFARGSVG
ncbi:MAG TPA: SDR family NAD(P)-dependent oxidoreductase [Acidisphaera sp.]|nr:SDR family NAD(P)-dependent oxidoreductase [Acidisphaera sp.]